MAAPSKNQRSGPAKQRLPKKCVAVHDIIWVKSVPVFGRARLIWTCMGETGELVLDCSA